MTSTERKTLFWVGGIAAFFFLLYLVSGILLPFIAGMLLAYFLDPVADRLEKFMSRNTAALLVIALFFTSFIGVVAIIAPPAYEQGVQLSSKIPGFFQSGQQKAQDAVNQALASLPRDQQQNIQSSLEEAAQLLLKQVPVFFINLWKSGLAIVNILSLLFITPVVSFYLLREWDNFKEKIDDLLPQDHADTIRGLMREIDLTLAGFIRGQTHVCLLLGTFYTLALWVVGLQSALLIGVLSGLLAFLPYVGVLMGMALGVGTAYFQFGAGTELASVFGIFVVAQIIEGNFITPKLVGDSIGLHPAWLIFGMLAGGSLFGFAGVLLAVPLTGIIGVLVRFAVREYRDSDLYKKHPSASSTKAQS